MIECAYRTRPLLALQEASVCLSVYGWSSLPLCQGSQLGFLVPLEHATSVVSGPDLITCNTAIVHLVEPLVSRLFDAILVSILPLLFSKIQSVWYLFIEGPTETHGWPILSLYLQTVLWQEWIRLDKLVILFLCHQGVRFLHLSK